MTHPPSPVITRTREGGGTVLTCEACQWIKFRWSDADADADQSEHAKKCKGAPEKKPEAAPKRSAAKWNDREGATWIDKL